MTMKIKPADIEWAKFAIRNRHSFNFSGRTPFEYPPGGKVNGIVAFKTFDSTGKVKPTRHPNLAGCLHNVKASVNLHLEMWKEGIADHTFSTVEILEHLIELDAPRWIIDSIQSFSVKTWVTSLNKGIEHE